MAPPPKSQQYYEFLQPYLEALQCTVNEVKVTVQSIDNRLKELETDVAVDRTKYGDMDTRVRKVEDAAEAYKYGNFSTRLNNVEQKVIDHDKVVDQMRSLIKGAWAVMLLIITGALTFIWALLTHQIMISFH
jgi:chromosome segregation ATPase